MSLEVELTLEGLVDRLDDLPQWLEQLRSWPLGLAVAGRPQQPDAQVGQLLLEVAAEVVLVADQCLALPLGGELRLDGEKVQQRLALVGLGPGQREGDRQALQGADQVQPQSPEVARVTGAVPVLSPSGQVGALDRLAGAAALHRRGVRDPQVVAPQRGVTGQRPGDAPDEPGGLAQPLVVAGLLGQVGEQVPQVSAGVPQPPRLGGEAEQRLHHRQRHQLRVAEPRHGPRSRPPRGTLRRILQQVVGLHVKCGREGVQLCLHTPTLDSLPPGAQVIRRFAS